MLQFLLPADHRLLCSYVKAGRYLDTLKFLDLQMPTLLTTFKVPYPLKNSLPLKTIWTNPSIRLTMYIPLNCSIVVEVYKSWQQSSYSLPTTVTELYTHLVLTILTRYLDSHPDYKLKNDKTDIEQFTDLLPPVSHHFNKLTQIAYDGVLSQQLIFQDQYIEHLGFLDSVTELFSTRREVTYSYNFLHLSLQEYLAAYYVSLKNIDKQEQLLKTMHKEQHLRNMGRFLAGITKYQGMDKALVKEIFEHECEKKRNGSLELSSYILQLLHESGDYSIINGHESYYCKLTDHSSLLDFAILGHCIANSGYKWTLDLGYFGNFMQSTNRIATLVQTLKSNNSPSYTIENIDCFYDSPECVECLLLELPRYALQQIQTLWLVSNNANPYSLPIQLYKHILSKMSRLHKLCLWYVPVTTNVAIAMSDLILCNNTLQEMEFVSNAISAEEKEALEKIKETKKDFGLSIHSQMKI